MAIVPFNQQQVSGGLSIQTVEDLNSLSAILVKSKFFQDCTDAAQAGVKVMAGLELGIGAFASMSGISIIKGKPAIGANLMAAMVKRSGRYNYRVLEHSDSICRIAFYEGKEQIGISEFTAADAARVGTQNMGKFPKNMLFARAMSNGVKWHCPDLFLGAPIYTPEELGATENEDGSIAVESTPVPATPHPNRIRIGAIGRMTGHSKEAIAEVWTATNLVQDATQLTPDQLVKLRDALFIDWAYQNHSQLFNHPTHVENSLNKLIAESGLTDDAQVWQAWVAKVEAKGAEQEPVEVPVEVA